MPLPRCGPVLGSCHRRNNRNGPAVASAVASPDFSGSLVSTISHQTHPFTPGAEDRVDLLLIDDDPADFMPLVLETNHSRFPVIGENKDDVIGILLAKELLNYYAEPEAFNLRDRLRPAVFVPESKRLNVLLREFRANRNHIAIVVDVTHATDQPGIALGPVTRHALGSGPVIARGTIVHPILVDLLCDTAEELGMSYTIESMGRATGTDADVVHNSRAGVATGIVSVPLRYMHSSVEMADLADIEATAKLLAAVAQKLTPELSLVR